MVTVPVLQALFVHLLGRVDPQQMMMSPTVIVLILQHVTASCSSSHLCPCQTTTAVLAQLLLLEVDEVGELLQEERLSQWAATQAAEAAAGVAADDAGIAEAAEAAEADMTFADAASARTSAVSSALPELGRVLQHRQHQRHCRCRRLLMLVIMLLLLHNSSSSTLQVQQPCLNSR